jgi:hypothetical protein
MFTEIVAIANERPVTLDDWEPFVGQTNHLSFEKSEPRGDVSGYPDADILSGVVWEFRVVNVLPLCGKVAITVKHEDGWNEPIHMDPDELAIRMEES